MTQIAVDVVLIPSEEMMNIAIQANRELLKQYPNKIILDRENCLPHISLAMGCIDQRQTEDIEIILQKITEEYSIWFLHIITIFRTSYHYGEGYYTYFF